MSRVQSSAYFTARSNSASVAQVCSRSWSGRRPVADAFDLPDHGCRPFLMSPRGSYHHPLGMMQRRCLSPAPRSRYGWRPSRATSQHRGHAPRPGVVAAGRWSSTPTSFCVWIFWVPPLPQSPSGARRVHVRCSSRGRRWSTFPHQLLPNGLESPSTFLTPPSPPPSSITSVT